MIKKFIRKMLGVKSKADTAGANNEPTVLSAKEHGINPNLLSSNAIRVTQTLQEAGFKAFVVGGAVRDLLLGVKPKDFDIATNATPEQVKRLFRRAFIIGKRFQIVHVMFGQDLLEVTTFRGTVTDGAPKDEHGRVLRDNTFGEQHEDAVRRDFTINAMYYDPATQTVLDYHDGIADIRKKTLRIIGVPEARYREDPVRMLRVVRFAAKLQFTIDPATSAPIAVMAPLINNVPTARVFDEMLKLLMSGHAMACLQQLRKEGLHHGLMPLLDVVLEQPLGEKFVTLALANTDERVRQGKPVSPGFLFASLLWHQVLEKWDAYKASGEFPIPALHLAADDVLNRQTDALALQRKIGSDMRDIWAMQPRFEKRAGKTPYKLLEHPRMRAGYDFLLLRCASGEIDAELGEWWTGFINGDGEEREHLLTVKPKQEAAAPKKRRPRRRGPRNPAAGGKPDSASE
ncbi:polynucleotide adenylyltransferase PcnB [Undibacterium terreum]|uniref:Poly(A) polymerase I n=1 Tax=Undibacterium terreum TaxID=1224302 RepID=A0A916XM44_9BURK|nr:polynucleotide adenylyltransferase PcnB [Undibacterium terreum]GGC83155.1 poly(A) polymerase I [Undibacterium terreum]